MVLTVVRLGSWPVAASLHSTRARSEHLLNTNYVSGRFPRWLGGEESACQCRRHGINPWIKKISWRRKWQPTPVFFPGKSRGQRSLAGYSHGVAELDMT